MTYREWQSAYELMSELSNNAGDEETYKKCELIKKILISAKVDRDLDEYDGDSL